MEIFIMILLIIVGMGLLILGADLFVDGAGGIAEKLRVSAFVIGMTIVAFGTSAPELAVSIKSMVSGNGDIAMGNAIGSNIMNILLILGISAIIRKLPVEKKTMFVEVPFLIAASVVLLLVAEVSGAMEITHLEGGLLVVLLAVYVGYMIIGAVRERKLIKASAGITPLDGTAIASCGAGGASIPDGATIDSTVKKDSGLLARLKSKVWFLIIMTIVGLMFVVLGAQLVVDNVDMLTAMMPEGNAKKIISVTVVALGTSLPELVTSVTAAIKGNTGLALGNIIGSNVLNILLILGLPSLIFSAAYTSSFLVDILVSIGAAVLLLASVGIGKGKAITRTGGVLMLVGLAGYLVYLFLA